MRARILSDTLTIIFITFYCLFLIYIQRVYGASMLGFAVTGMGYVSFYHLSGQLRVTQISRLKAIIFIPEEFMLSYILELFPPVPDNASNE